jgi:lysophospholipase L1-like esterase
MRRVKTVLLALALASGAGSAFAQVNFNDYVSVGDSLAAGFSSGSLVETHQRNSVPALLARQAGLPRFEQPTVSEPGIPVELTLVTLSPRTIIAPKASAPGSPTNLALPRPYNNLAVPGATSIDALETVSDDGGLHDMILRGIGTQVQQAKLLRPSFITLWIGNNDVLGAAIAGRAVDGVTLTPTAVFADVYRSIVAELQASGAQIVAANLPDVTAIPFVTTIPPVVVNPATRQPVQVNGASVPLIGPSGPLPSNTLVTLAAASLLAKGVGIPKELGGAGTPLPDEVLLDANERSVIREHVAADNQAIADVCAAARIPVVDLNAVLNELNAHGREVGGIHLTSDFLTGGIFSYDGIHLTDLGYAIVANEWIDVINERSGGSLPLVDLSPFLSASAATRQPARAEFSQEAWDNLREIFRVR